MTEKTQDQLNAEAAAAAKAQKKAEAAAAKEAAKQEREAKKAAKQAEAEAAKAAKEAAKGAKEAEKQAKLDAAAAAKQAKIDAKAAKEAEREAKRQPEQNGVRRPGPEGKCGQAWSLFDETSTKLGQPTPIADVMDIAKERGLNEANVRTEYARWKKFHGLTGRISLPKPAVTEGAQATA